MYSNVFCALDCISESSKGRKTLDFHAESGNKRVFQSRNHEILIGDMIAISSVVFHVISFVYLINSIDAILSHISFARRKCINSYFEILLFIIEFSKK